MSELRLYAVVNKEALKAAGGNRGKMMAQAGHAFLHAYWDAEIRSKFTREKAERYRNSQAAAKIVLGAENEAQLRQWYGELYENDELCGVTLVTDAGRTVFPEPTVTFLGIGPITKEEAPEWLQQLRPMI